MGVRQRDVLIEHHGHGATVFIPLSWSLNADKRFEVVNVDDGAPDESERHFGRFGSRA
jgi:hypothetical protein